MSENPRFEIRGPYSDSTFAVVEDGGGVKYGRGFFKSRAEAQARLAELSTQGDQP